MMRESTDAAYVLARQRYADLGVDTDAALERLRTVPISLHCWQGDDVGGFEEPDGKLGGGLAATGNYPGKARTPDELRRDAAKALSLIPGTHRFNLHAFTTEDDIVGDVRNFMMRPASWYRRTFARAGLDAVGLGLWISRQRGSEWHQALSMPVDNCIERLDNHQRLDRLMLQDRLHGIAKAKTAHDNI